MRLESSLTGHGDEYLETSLAAKLPETHRPVPRERVLLHRVAALNRAERPLSFLESVAHERMHERRKKGLGEWIYKPIRC